MKARRWTTGIVVILFSGILLMLWGCLAELRVYDPDPSDRAALHTVCCAGLEKVMGKINKPYRRAYRLPIRQMRDRNFSELAKRADEIAAHAGTIRPSADLAGASSRDRAAFERLADGLQTTARALSTAAAAKDRNRVRELFSKLTATCNSCHAAFRGSHGAKGHGDS